MEDKAHVFHVLHLKTAKNHICYLSKDRLIYRKYKILFNEVLIRNIFFQIFLEIPATTCRIVYLIGKYVW